MTIWIGLLLGACVIAVPLLTVWRHRGQTAELGTVSAQWLSEHREFDQHYSDR